MGRSIERASRRLVVSVGVGTLLIAVLLLLHVGMGTVWISPDRVLAALLDRAHDPVDRQIVWDLRAPRAIVGLIRGAMLGLSGALLQVTMRNPLADPWLTGVSTGGVLAGVLVLSGIIGIAVSGPGLTLVVLAGCLAGGGLVYLLSVQRGRVEPIRLVLIAVIVNAALALITSLLMLRAGNAIGGMLPWLIGSLNATVWDDVWRVVPVALLAIPAAALTARVVTVLQLSDDVAASVGVRVQLARSAIFVVAAALAAGTVSVTAPSGSWA